MVSTSHPASALPPPVLRHPPAAAAAHTVVLIQAAAVQLAGAEEEGGAVSALEAAIGDSHPQVHQPSSPPGGLRELNEADEPEASEDDDILTMTMREGMKTPWADC